MMDSPQVAFELWQEVASADPSFEPDKEQLVAVPLNAKLRPTGYHVVSVGSLNEAIARPREIFRAAIVAGAYAFVLMHTHPSRDPMSSEADRRMTRKIQEGAEIIGINSPDYVVVGTAEGGRLPSSASKTRDCCRAITS